MKQENALGIIVRKFERISYELRVIRLHLPANDVDLETQFRKLSNFYPSCHRH